jgi:hypothetical protein
MWTIALGNADEDPRQAKVQDALNSHLPFNVHDFNEVWVEGSASSRLELLTRVFCVLEEWGMKMWSASSVRAFDDERASDLLARTEACQAKLRYVRIYIFPLIMWDVQVPLTSSYCFFCRLNTMRDTYTCPQENFERLKTLAHDRSSLVAKRMSAVRDAIAEKELAGRFVVNVCDSIPQGLLFCLHSSLM